MSTRALIAWPTRPAEPSARGNPVKTDPPLTASDWLPGTYGYATTTANIRSSPLAMRRVGSAVSGMRKIVNSAGVEPGDRVARDPGDLVRPQHRRAADFQVGGGGPGDAPGAHGSGDLLDQQRQSGNEHDASGGAWKGVGSGRPQPADGATSPPIHSAGGVSRPT